MMKWLSPDETVGSNPGYHVWLTSAFVLKSVGITIGATALSEALDRELAVE